MKTLTDRINEALKIGKNLSEWSVYSCQPKTKKELKEIIKDRISKEGTKCDLNDIDVSLIDDMDSLFYDSDFTGDISEWNVSNAKNIQNMFRFSKFNGDISKWDVSSVENTSHMFENSKFNNDISKWNTSAVKDMCSMFMHSKFNGDISNWKINKKCNIWFMFDGCPIKEEYKPVLPK